MEVRSDLKKAEEQVRRRWDLPKDADVEFHEVEKSKPCKHYFVQVTGQWIECKKCHWGLQVSVNDKIVNGHLYSNGRKVI